MTPDAFSRALRGQRAFSAIELARVAEVLGADVHWLITGIPDPQNFAVAARHDYDSATAERSVPDHAADQIQLNNIALAYRQAKSPALQNRPLPSGSVTDIRDALGDRFVRHFADKLEEHLAIDVIRISGLSTSYSLRASSHRVIVIAATGNWFRQNWSLAHELGHLIKNHHVTATSASDEHEAQANAFAAEILLPSDELAAIDWVNIDATQLARRVWDFGVSTDALFRRLARLSIPASQILETWAGQPTQRLLRRHLLDESVAKDPITKRMDEASTRRFLLHLQDAHLDSIASGRLGKGPLAWMLGVSPDALEIDSPEAAPKVSSEALAAALELR